ncbi:hypothetical protein ABZ719_16815 [Streptomyces sp. NPDC006743]|uniref:hypothetical protein n=1 Tax=Streptomyces sp. NPDC006743 TaxID=3154480 RepID=UPI003456DE26
MTSGDFAARAAAGASIGAGRVHLRAPATAVNPAAGGWKLFARGTTGNAGADAYLVVEASERG